MSQLLEFINVSYWYKHENKEQNILKDVNVGFEKGKFYTITGHSGSGKTTFLSLAGALDIPKAGQVLYEGKDINKIGLSNFRNKYVSIVFQSYNLLPYMTALQNVLTAMEITGSTVINKKEYALKMLESVGIQEQQARQRVLTLSGGQQQRVAIARSLCSQSDLIIADEPTGNLDETTAADIVRIFKDLAHKENKCIIVVTHDNYIASISDITVNISKGSLTVVSNRKVALS